MPPRDRRTVLDQSLRKYAAEGWRLEARSDFQAMIAKGKTTGERLLSFGLGDRVKRCWLTVDEAGELTSREVRFVLG